MDIFAALQQLGSLIRQIQGALGGRRMNIRGLVAADGSISAGSGFSLTHTASSGSYAITYNTAFDTEAFVQVTLAITGGTLGWKVSSASVTGCTIATYNSSTGANTDAAFYLAVDGK